MRNLIVLFSFFTAACNNTPAPIDEGDGPDVLDESKADGTTTYGYYSVRRDHRRCAAPACGGFFVTRANRPETRCDDGSYAAECYVAEIDFSALPIYFEQKVELENSPPGIVRGRLEPKAFDRGNYGVFVAKEAWQGSKSGAAGGTFSILRTNHLLDCNRAPCANIDLFRLNSVKVDHLSEFDLSATGASMEAIDAAKVDVSNGVGLIVRGELQSTYSAQQFFRKVAKPMIDCRAVLCAAGEQCTPESGCQPVEPEIDCRAALCEPNSICIQGHGCQKTTGADCRVILCSASTQCYQNVGCL